MKMKVETVEVPDEGLFALMGKRVTLMCSNYFYLGTLVGVNDTCVKLDSPSIVYETGAFTDTKYKDAQALPNSIYVQISHIEAFGIIKEQ